MASSRWTKHIKDKTAKVEYEERLQHMSDVWDVLKNILQEDLNALDNDSMNKKHYFMPAWSEYQADRVGSKRTLKKIIELLP